MKKVFICNLYNDNENSTCIPLFTTDEDIARATDQSYELASLEDIEACDITSAHLDESIIHLQEGICIWKEVFLESGFGETESYWTYQLISNTEYIYHEPAAS